MTRKKPTGNVEIYCMEVPKCDFCSAQHTDKDAEYFFRTAWNKWINGCPRHWRMYSMYRDLGDNKGQRYILIPKIEVE